MITRTKRVQRMLYYYYYFIILQSAIYRKLLYENAAIGTQ